MTVFEHSLPMSVLVLALIAAVAAGGFSAWRFLPRNKGNILLALLYVLVLLGLSWCLLLPGRKDVFTELMKPRFVIALDASQSMTMRPSEDVKDRWTVAREALDQPWFDSISKECEVEIFPFESAVREAIPRSAAETMLPDGSSTLLRDSLRQITERLAGLDVAGGLLLSDGIDTRDAFDDWASDPRPFPIFSLRLEPPGEWEKEPDLRIDTVATARRVTVGWKTKFTVRISGQGTAGAPVSVQVFQGDVLRHEQPVTIPDDGGEREVVFELEHPEVGSFNYRAVIPPMEGESNKDDNEYIAAVQVVDARNRLLYVEGIPRWDYKFLRRVLMNHPKISPVIFFSGPDGSPKVGSQVGNMTSEMTAAQLSYFKIVVVGNIDAEELGYDRALNLVQFVESGGSLVLLGGSKAWGSGGIFETELGNILPIRVEGVQPLLAKTPFPVTLSDEARSHPAFAGDPELWNVIPPVLSVFAGGELAPAAQALVTAETSQGPTPIVATQRYGQGKVTAIMTDSLWRWQLGPEAAETQPYPRFWTQLINWLLPQEEDVDTAKIEVFTERNEVYLGEEFELLARIGEDVSVSADGVECRVTGPDGREIPYKMASQQVMTSSGKTFPGFVLPFTAEQAGLHRVVGVVKTEGGEEESKPFAFFVKPYSPETKPRPVKNEILQSIAEASGGQFFESIEDLNRVLGSLELSAVEEETAEFRTLWRTWLMIGILIAFLAGTWALRKFRNMP